MLNLSNYLNNIKYSNIYPDFTKYTKKGVDDMDHYGEHYCCLINALIQLGCDGSVLLEARTCITGLFVPKSALKEFCDIARIKIKLYWWYENNTKQGKKLKNANMWDKTNECLKDAPLFEIGIIEDHYIAYKNTDITKYAIENYEKVKHKNKLVVTIQKTGDKRKKYMKCFKERNNFSDKLE